MRTTILSCVMMLLAGLACQVWADDYESPGVRGAVDRQVAPYGLPGWNSLTSPRARTDLILPQIPPALLAEQTARSERLLDKIIIASVVIRDVPLAQALTRLQTEIALGDKADAALMGMQLESGKGRIHLRSYVLGKGPDYNPIVTVQMQGATAREVLRRLTEPLGLQVKVNGTLIVLMAPRDEDR